MWFLFRPPSLQPFSSGEDDVKNIMAHPICTRSVAVVSKKFFLPISWIFWKIIHRKQLIHLIFGNLQKKLLEGRWVAHIVDIHRWCSQWHGHQRVAAPLMSSCRQPGSSVLTHCCVCVKYVFCFSFVLFVWNSEEGKCNETWNLNYVQPAVQYAPMFSDVGNFLSRS